MENWFVNILPDWFCVRSVMILLLHTGSFHSTVLQKFCRIKMPGGLGLVMNRLGLVMGRLGLVMTRLVRSRLGLVMSRLRLVMSRLGLVGWDLL